MQLVRENKVQLDVAYGLVCHYLELHFKIQLVSQSVIVYVFFKTLDSQIKLSSSYTKTTSSLSELAQKVSVQLTVTVGRRKYWSIRAL